EAIRAGEEVRKFDDQLADFHRRLETIRGGSKLPPAGAPVPGVEPPPPPPTAGPVTPPPVSEPDPVKAPVPFNLDLLCDPKSGKLLEPVSVGVAAASCGFHKKSIRRLMQQGSIGYHGPKSHRRPFVADLIERYPPVKPE